MTKKFVTVIVPTYEDWQRLAVCVSALAGQTYPKDAYEVIIINNNPEDTAPAGFVLPERFMLIAEKKPGSYAARNAGLQLAKGEIIGFTDSDCIPDKDWIQNAVSYFQAHPGCSRIAGRIAIFFQRVKPTVAELYNTLYSFPQKKHVNETGTSVTGNLFSRKEVFDKVGCFDEKLLSLGDLEWGRMATKAGYRVDYVDNVMVKHPARSLQELIKKEKRVGGGIGMRERGKTTISIFQVLNEYRPRLAEIRFIYKNGEGLSMFEKLKILALRHYLLIVRANEKLKVHSGKMPNRA